MGARSTREKRGEEKIPTLSTIKDVVSNLLKRGEKEASSD